MWPTRYIGVNRHREDKLVVLAIKIIKMILRPSKSAATLTIERDTEQAALIKSPHNPEFINHVAPGVHQI